MAENISHRIIQNEIALMRSLISQCNEETLLAGGRVGKKDRMIFHYELPSGLHIYSEKPFNFENIYKKDININEAGNYIYITSQPVEKLHSLDNNEFVHNIIDYQNIPFIQYSESRGIDIKYNISNYVPMGIGNFLDTRSKVNISSEPYSNNPINGTLLIENKKGYHISQDELSEFAQGSEYFSDIVQKVIKENSKYDTVELLNASKRVRPLFEMLSIEKEKLQEKGNDNRDQIQETKPEDERMSELRIAVEGLKKLKLTQDEIGYLETVLEEFRENNNQEQNAHDRSEEK